MIWWGVSTADGRNSQIKALCDPLDEVGIFLLQPQARQLFCPHSFVVWGERVMPSLLEDILELRGRPARNLSICVGLDGLWTYSLLGPASRSKAGGRSLQPIALAHFFKRHMVPHSTVWRCCTLRTCDRGVRGRQHRLHHVSVTIRTYRTGFYLFYSVY